MRKYELVVLDLDGTLYSAGKVISGAREAVEAVRRMGISVRFITNTFTKTVTEILDKLSGFGINVFDCELITPHNVLFSRYRAAPDTSVLVFSDAALMPLYKWLPRKSRLWETGLGKNEKWDEVLVVDSGTLWSYEAFDDLAQAIFSGSMLVASSATGSFIGKEGLRHPDTGAAISLLEKITGVQAIIAGKPGIAMAKEAIMDYGFDPSRTIVVGDDPNVDIAFANKINARSILVKTGLYSKNDTRKTDADFVLESVAQLPSFFENGS